MSESKGIPWDKVGELIDFLGSKDMELNLRVGGQDVVLMESKAGQVSLDVRDETALGALIREVSKVAKGSA